MAGPFQRKRQAGRILVLAAAGLCIAQLACPRARYAPAFVEDDSDTVTKQPSAFGKFVSENSTAAFCVVMLLSLVVAKMQTPVTPPAQVALEKRGDYGAVVIINSLLSLTAGMLNALAFLEMAATIAHHSGNLTHWGRNWGIDSVRFGLYLLGFLAGGAVIGYTKADCEAIFVGRFSLTMLSAVIPVIGGTVINLAGGPALPTLVLWAYALGVQNGICRKFSSMPLCSTHFTGYLTDAGNGIGTWLRAQILGEASPDMKRTNLFMACMLCFAAGGFFAKMGRDMYGLQVAFVPAVLMALVAFAIIPLPGAPAKK